MRSMFLSKMVYQTYNGYVMSQFKKMQADLRNKGGPKWKHVMHLIRLLLSGIAVLSEGVVPVHVGEHRDRLLADPSGRAGVGRGGGVADRPAPPSSTAAFETTTLPERPDYAAGERILLKARRGAV